MSENSALPIMETFYSVQGEGAYSGTAAYFIRTGGCDVGCHWCDVKESWDPQKHALRNISDIVGEIPHHVQTVIITGGEPLMWDLTLLTAALKARGIRTHLETSGAYPLTGSWDWICLSPKKMALPKPEIYAQAHELKVIVYNKQDLLFGVAQAQKVGPDCQLLLQPEWSKRQDLNDYIVAYVKDNPKWRISLQTHKYLDIR